MKNSITIMALICSTVLVSCVKVEKTKVKLPETKKTEAYVAKKAGYKCDIIGQEENKEIFLEIKKKDNMTSVSFHDFIDSRKISVISATFEDYKILSFSLSETAEDSKVLSGKGILSHSNLSSLSDEGKVISITGRLTLNKDMSGILEQKQLISKEDLSVQNTEFKELGKIEHCESFEAVWL